MGPSRCNGFRLCDWRHILNSSAVSLSMAGSSKWPILSLSHLLLLLDNVVNNSKLLSLRRSKHSSTLSYNHGRVLVMITNLARFEQCRHFRLLILKIELVFEVRVSWWLEDLIDISRSDFIHILGCYDLLLFSVLLEHTIKQLGHALRWLELENSLGLLSFANLLSFLIFFFGDSKTLIWGFDV